MRVGIISPYSLTLPGGVQNQILGLARKLRSLGVNTRVLGPCDGPPPDAGVTSLGSSLPTAANGSVAPIAPDPSAQLRVMRAVRDEAFDVIHLHEPLAPGPTMTVAGTKSAPLVGTFHAAGESLAYKYTRRPARWLANHLDVRVAVSDEAAKFAKATLGGSYEVLYNGVELDRYLDVKPAASAGPTIFFCGRHEPRKGLSVLLDAMQALPSQVQLWVASDGPETADLRSRWAGDPRISWLGRLSETEKIARYRAADVFCAPSLHGESFGVVLLEAMAAETAVVASDLVGYSNVARAGRDALLTPPGDSEALSRALNMALFDSTIRRALVTSGMERAEEFSMRRLASSYLTIYEEVLSAPGSSVKPAPPRGNGLLHRMNPLSLRSPRERRSP